MLQTKLLKQQLRQLWENIRGPWRKRLVRSLVVFVTALCIGQFGAWLIESSRWLGVAEGREIEEESQAARYIRLTTVSVAETLGRYSFDIPQMCRGSRRGRFPDEVCIIYMDDRSAVELKQPGMYDRKLHASLVRRLKEAGARAIFFDIVFDGDDSQPTPSDLEFAAALKETGNVYIGGATEESISERVNVTRGIAPKKIFRAGARWGLLVFKPIDPDQGIRALYGGMERFPNLTWIMAKNLGAKLPEEADERMKLRWLNYYGPFGTFRNFSYAEAMAPNGVKEGAFKDKIVFIGSRVSLATSGTDSKDAFRTPYTMRFNGMFSPGVEIHATAALNLLRGESLTRFPNEIEKRVVFWFGFILTIVLMPRAPWLVILSCILASVGVAVLALEGVERWHVWGNWLVPAVVVPGIVAFANYLLEGRRRNAIIGAFGKYLSPEMAKQISTQDVDLKPGGKVVSGTIMFTDLEGFTSLSEELDDPERLARILSQYFTQCTGHVLQLKGTIAKFIGDAVLAVWGAPIPDKDHVRNAVLSAWRLHKDSEIVIDGKPLVVRGKKVRTRVGVHTGRVLAGNLGSTERFDWTVVGDPVNLAARLESLNKHLGTSVLVSDAAFLGMGPGFTTRRLGAFIMKGKTSSLVIHELLGEKGVDPVPAWLPDFNAGVAAFEEGAPAKAAEFFQKVVAACGGSDGPSGFYLAEIERRAAAPAAAWEAEIELREK